MTTPVPYEQAIADAGEAIADGLVRQSQRTPRDAAVAAIGRSATESEICSWIATHRPAHARSA